MATKSDKKSSLKKWTSTTPRVIRMFISGGGYRILLKTFHLHKAFSLPFSLPFLHPVSDPAILSINDKKAQVSKPQWFPYPSQKDLILYIRTHIHTPIQTIGTTLQSVKPTSFGMAKDKTNNNNMREAIKTRRALRARFSFARRKKNRRQTFA